VGCSPGGRASDHEPQICPLAAPFWPWLAADPVKAIHGRFLPRCRVLGRAWLSEKVEAANVDLQIGNSSDLPAFRLLPASRRADPPSRPQARSGARPARWARPRSPRTRPESSELPPREVDIDIAFGCEPEAVKKSLGGGGSEASGSELTVIHEGVDVALRQRFLQTVLRGALGNEIILVLE
jgi:hypothetical protein